MLLQLGRFPLNFVMTKCVLVPVKHKKKDNSAFSACIAEETEYNPFKLTQHGATDCTVSLSNFKKKNVQISNGVKMASDITLEKFFLLL